MCVHSYDLNLFLVFLLFLLFTYFNHHVVDVQVVSFFVVYKRLFFIIAKIQGKYCDNFNIKLCHLTTNTSVRLHFSLPLMTNADKNL